MLKDLLENANEALVVVGVLAALVSIIVEMTKDLLPKSFPTKALVMIISLIITITSIILFCGVNIQLIFGGIIGGFIVSYVSMYGFDTLKEIFNRFKINKD